MDESTTGLAAILTKAMQLERDGHAFYLKAAEQSGQVVFSYGWPCGAARFGRLPWSMP